MSENVGILVADVARLMRRTFDARARDVGATRPQWQVLSVLKRHEGINQGGLAELLEVESITLCRMVDRLQEAQLVERRSDPSDRRAWRLFLTPKAMELIEQLRPMAICMFDEAMDGLTELEQDQLHSLLSRVRGNLTHRPLQKGESHG